MARIALDPEAIPASTLRGRAQRVITFLMPVSSGVVNEILALDGLRALAVLFVVWLHVASFANNAGALRPPDLLGRLAAFGGGYGVYLFFNLSGFLLFLPFARAILSGRPLPSFRNFYLRRVLRILPLYYTVTLLLVFLKEPQFLQSGHRTALLLNLLMLGDIRYDSIGAISTQFWTLSIEFQFYLILPLIAWGLAKLAGRRINGWAATRIALGILSIIIVGLAMRYWIDYYHYVKHFDQISRKDALHYLFQLIYGVRGKYIEIFALGIGVSFLYVVWVEQKRMRVFWQNSIGLVSLVIALTLIAIGLAVINDFPGAPGTIDWFANMQFQTFSPWIEGVCGMFLMMSVLLSPAFIKSLWSLYPLRYIGLVSYGVYLWHFPLLESLTPAIIPNNKGAGDILLWIVGLFVSLAFATTTYYLVEKPFLQMRLNLRKSQPLPPEPMPETTLQEMQTAKRPAMLVGDVATIVAEPHLER